VNWKKIQEIQWPREVRHCLGCGRKLPDQDRYAGAVVFVPQGGDHWRIGYRCKRCWKEWLDL
jgi:DNA-directed RNA polymerase subunit RPC12/RpoP